ncbi:MAG: hypothetical protein ACXVCP_03985 [Bdellovibrio sp.]
MNFFSENLQLFKKVFLPLFVLVVFTNNIDQYLNIRIESALMDPTAPQQKIFLFGFLSLLSSIIFPILCLTAALYGLNCLSGWNKSLSAFLQKNLNQIYIETLRSWGKTLLWSLLFILPGIWKFIEYGLVPFVVTSSPKYDDGKEDALKRSAEIVRHHKLLVAGVFIFFHIFIPLTLSALFDSYRLLWKTPISSLLLSALDAYLLLISTQILFNIFKKEEKHVTHV